MNKTLSMIIDDTKQELFNVCGSSNLPLCILEMIVKDVYYEIEVLAKNELLRDAEKVKAQELAGVNRTENDADVIKE